MNEKQRVLIDYFNSLSVPTPPTPTSQDLSAFHEEGLVPSPGSLTPAKPSPDWVRTMLEKRRTTALEGDNTEESISTFPPEVLTTGAGTGNMQRRSEATEPPITEHVIELAVSATEKALNDVEMDPEESEILEAIILPNLRPVLDIIDGDISPPPPKWEFLADYRAVIQGILPCIGRINVPELASRIPYAGTGFFVGDGLLMTNRHVAQLFIEGFGAGPKYLRFVSGLSANFDPQYEVGDLDPGAGSDQYEIVEALLVHPHWDAALLRVQPIGPAKLPPSLRLARHTIPGFSGGFVPNIVVIGYPFMDARGDQALQWSIFRGIFGRKRLLPGYLTGFQDVVKSWGATQHAITHDATTLGGNSGSAVVDLTSGFVVALHFGGEYKKANYGIPTWELACDSRVVDLGVLFENLPGVPPYRNSPNNGPAASQDWLNAWDRVEPLFTEAVSSTSLFSPLGEKALALDASVLPIIPSSFETNSQVLSGRVSEGVEGVHAMSNLDDITVEKTLRILAGKVSMPIERASLLVDIMTARNEADQVEVMKLIIEGYGNPKVMDDYLGNTYQGRTMSDVIYSKLLGQYLDIVTGTMKLIIQSRKSLDEAAKSLRDMVFGVSTEDVRTKDFILLAVIEDIAVPYAPIPGTEFEEYAGDKLKVIWKKHTKELAQLSCILRAGFGTTARAGLVLEVLDQVEPNEDRIGILELMLQRLEKIANPGYP